MTRRRSRRCRRFHKLLHLFFHSGDVLTMCVRAVSMQRWTDAQKKFEGVTEIVSVVAIEAVRTIIDRKLSAEPDIDAVAMRHIADITNRVSAHRKDVGFIGGIENQLVARFLHPLPAYVNGVTFTLIV